VLYWPKEKWKKKRDCISTFDCKSSVQTSSSLLPHYTASVWHHATPDMKLKCSNTLLSLCLNITVNNWQRSELVWKMKSGDSSCDRFAISLRFKWRLVTVRQTGGVVRRSSPDRNEYTWVTNDNDVYFSANMHIRSSYKAVVHNMGSGDTQESWDLGGREGGMEPVKHLSSQHSTALWIDKSLQNRVPGKKKLLKRGSVAKYAYQFGGPYGWKCLRTTDIV